MALTLEELEAMRDGILREMALPAEQHFGDQGLTRRSTKELESVLARVNGAIDAILSEGTSGGRITRIRTQQSY